MVNAAKMTYYWNGKILHRIGPPNFSKIAQGDVAILYGMSPTNDPIGFAEGQHSAFSVTFTTPVFRDIEPEVDWDLLARTHVEGVLTEAGGIRPKSWKMKVESAEGNPDDKRNKALTVIMKGWQIGAA
jgi:hypothetical protein